VTGFQNKLQVSRVNQLLARQQSFHQPSAMIRKTGFVRQASHQILRRLGGVFEEQSISNTDTLSEVQEETMDMT